MIRIAQIQVMVFDGTPVNRTLRQWVEKCPNHAFASHLTKKRYPDLMSLWRNQMCEWFLRATTLDYILLLDADMIPCVEMLPILTRPADVMGCNYTQPDGIDTHDGMPGCGCLRLSRYALESMETPWFDFVLAPSGVAVEHCECSHLRMRAKNAGFHPVFEGRMMHIVDAYVKPDGEGGYETELLANHGLDGKLK